MDGSKRWQDMKYDLSVDIDTIDTNWYLQSFLWALPMCNLQSYRPFGMPVAQCAGRKQRGGVQSWSLGNGTAKITSNHWAEKVPYSTGFQRFRTSSRTISSPMKQRITSTPVTSWPWQCGLRCSGIFEMQVGGEHLYRNIYESMKIVQPQKWWPFFWGATVFLDGILVIWVDWPWSGVEDPWSTQIQPDGSEAGADLAGTIIIYDQLGIIRAVGNLWTTHSPANLPTLAVHELVSHRKTAKSNAGLVINKLTSKQLDLTIATSSGIGSLPMHSSCWTVGGSQTGSCHTCSASSAPKKVLLSGDVETPLWEELWSRDSFFYASPAGRCTKHFVSVKGSNLRTFYRHFFCKLYNGNGQRVFLPSLRLRRTWTWSQTLKPSSAPW